MKYLNQLEYEHIPYPTRTKEEEYAPNGAATTVKSSGCGLCCVCMAIDIITDTTLDIEECVRISRECEANYSTGTDMNVLGPVIAEKFNIEYSKTSDLDEAIRYLQSGSAVIAYVVVPEGSEIGLFTKSGHYVLLVSTDGKEFSILDPSYTPEKFTIPERMGKVNFENAPYLYCDTGILHSETKVGKPKYHIFSRKKK